MSLFDEYFPNLSHFDHADLFDNRARPWEPLANLGSEIEQRLTRLASKALKVDSLAETSAIPREKLTKYKEPGILVQEWVELKEPTYIEPAHIWIGAGTILEPTAVIKGPAIIGAQCEVRQGAYLRGNVLTGDGCVLGHCTEIKNSVLMNHAECGHFNYVGDSLIGSYVNMGAGSKLANLEFRTPEQKKAIDFPVIHADWEGRRTSTGLQKLGVLLGDYAEIGCNAVLCPGVFLGQNCRVHPNLTVYRGEYPPGTRFLTSNPRAHP